MNTKSKVIVVTGKKDIGKTTLIKKIFLKFKKKCFIIGFCEIKTPSSEKYFIENLVTSEKFKWAEREKYPSKNSKCTYRFFQENLSMIHDSIIKDMEVTKDFVFIFDEYGRLENKYEGLYTLFKELAIKSKVLIIVVQKSILNEFIKKNFNFFEEYRIFDLNDMIDDCKELLSLLRSWI